VLLIKCDGETGLFVILSCIRRTNGVAQIINDGSANALDRNISITHRRQTTRLLKTQGHVNLLGILLIARSGRKTRIVLMADKLRSSIDTAYSTTLQHAISIVCLSVQRTASYFMCYKYFTERVDRTIAYAQCLPVCHSVCPSVCLLQQVF